MSAINKPITGIFTATIFCSNINKIAVINVTPIPIPIPLNMPLEKFLIKSFFLSPNNSTKSKNLFLSKDLFC